MKRMRSYQYSFKIFISSTENPNPTGSFDDTVAMTVTLLKKGRKVDAPAKKITKTVTAAGLLKLFFAIL